MVGLGCFGPSASAPAQSPDVAGTEIRLAPAYAQMLTLTLVPDISTAHYVAEGASNELAIDVTRVPQEVRLRSLGDGADLFARVTGGYLKMKATFPLSAPAAGAVTTRWTAYGLSGGLAAKIRLGHGFTFVPAIDAGLARLGNGAEYTGSAVTLRPLLDGAVFNWNTDAWVATPHLGVDWVSDSVGRTVNVHGHVAWSRIATYGESLPGHRFIETAGVWSIRADHAAPTGAQVFGRPLDWVAYGGHSGFFGPNRSALGFPSVSELGLGIEAPLVASSDASRRLRVGASYLFGPHLRGWSLSLGLQH